MGNYTDLMYAYITPKSKATLAKLKANIEQMYAELGMPIGVRTIASSLEIEIKKFKFRIDFNASKDIHDEAVALSEEHLGTVEEQSKIASCRARFELGGDVTSKLKFEDHLIYLQECWESLGGVLTYNVTEGGFNNFG